MAVIELTPEEQERSQRQARIGNLPEETPQYGSWENYMTNFSHLGMDMYHPDLALSKSGEGITMTPEFNAVYEVADGDTKQAMLRADNNMDAFKLYERRSIEDKSLQNIANDSFIKQFGVGVFAGSVSYSSLLPIGTVAGIMYKTAVTSSKLMHVAKSVAAGATAGGAAAVYDEAMFKSNGQHYDYGTGLMYGMAFGGGLGFLGGLASKAPHLMVNSAGVPPHQSLISADVEVMPDGSIRAAGTEGVVQQGGIFSKIPGVRQVTAFLDSDVAIAYKSKSQAVRDYIALIANSTVATRDVNGVPIPQKKAGTDYRRGLMWYWHKANRGLDADFNAHKLDGGEYNMNSFFEEVDKHFSQTVVKQEIDAYNYAHSYSTNERLRLQNLEASYKLNPNNTTIETALKQARRDVAKVMDDKLNEFYKQKVDWSHTNKHIAAGAQRYATYFQDFSKSGKELGMKQFLRQREGKLYKPRIYDYDRMGKLDQADIKDRLTRGFRGHRGNDDLSNAEVDMLVSDAMRSMSRGVFNQNFSHNSYLMPSAPAGSRLAGRKFKLDERELGDMIRTNMNDVGGAYNQQMTGRQSVTFALGNEPDARTAEMEAKVEAEGLTNDPQVKLDVQAAIAATRDLDGTLRMNTLSGKPGWTFARNVMAYNSGRLGTGFGANQAIEGSATLAMNGLRNLFAGGVGRSLKDARNLMFGDGQNVSAMSEHLIKFGYMEDALMASRVNAVADTEVGLNPGMFEAKLHGFNNWLQKWNGMRPLKAAMESNTAAATMSEISKLAKQTKYSDSDLARIARWGMDDDSLKAIAKDIDTHIDTSIGKFDIHKFDNLDQFQLAVTRGLEEVVIQGNSIHMPRWMKDHTGGPLLKMLTQFMRFPLIAHNQLLKRAIGEDKARMGGSIVAGSLTFMSIKYLVEQAEIAAGLRHEADTRYDYFGRNGEEAISKGFMESMNLSAATGMVGTGVNWTANFTGHSEMGRNYISRNPGETYLGPSYGLFQDSIKFATTIAEGDMSTERFFTEGKTFLLMQNAFMAGKAYDAMAEAL